MRTAYAVTWRVEAYRCPCTYEFESLNEGSYCAGIGRLSQSFTRRYFILPRKIDQLSDACMPFLALERGLSINCSCIALSADFKGLHQSCCHALVPSPNDR